MKLLVDAQFSRRVTSWFNSVGCDAIHTLDLVSGNSTTDIAINTISDVENRVVMTKDSDFVDSHLLQGSPHKLLLVTAGNLTNKELEALLVPLIPSLIADFETNNFLELTEQGIVMRD